MNVAAWQPLLDWQRIYAWADQKEPGAVLGESCTNSSCPLALYLYEQTGIHWSVGPSIRPADGTKQDRLQKPSWAETLIKQTDQATGNERGQVTREQFLTVLEQVREEAEAYTPTPADEALHLTLLTGHVCLRVQREYAGGNIADLETYNRLYEAARQADGQARKLFDLLERLEKEGR